MRFNTARGFSFIELLVSMAIMLIITSSMFEFVYSARHLFEIDLERADMQQRARVSLDSLFRDLVMAGAGLQIPAIAPFRRGDTNPDSPGSAFSDRISVRYLLPDSVTGEVVTITYAQQVDAGGVPQLTRYDGLTTDLPVADQVVGIRFEYFDASGQQIAMGRFTDGPWVPNATAADRFDADLHGIRRVRAKVRVRPARVFVGFPLTDLDAEIDLSPRNVLE